MNEARLAILILAHKNIDQLVRLVKSMRNPKVDIYIHLDSKWEIKENDLILLKDCSNVLVIDKRESVYLDEWSLVEATLNLMTEANKNKCCYIYYALLSGQDYPIIPVDNIVEDLEKAYPKPLIDCTPWSSDNWLYSKFNKSRSFNKLDMFLNKRLNRGFLRKVLKLVFLTPVYFFPSQLKKIQKNKIDIYGGSAWWILPNKVIEFILSEVVKETEVMNLLKGIKTPEEIFFQVMTMRSKLANLVEINPPDMVEQNCKTYAFFSGDGKKFMGHPHNFMVENYSKLNELREEKFFARKFDIMIDSKILDMIDENFL